MGLQITFTTDGLKESEIDALYALLDRLAGREPVLLPPPARADMQTHIPGFRVMGEITAPVVDMEAAFGGPTASSAAPLAPGASHVPSPTPPAGVPLDADDLPWDARIHSGNKETTAEGKWRKRRGVHEETMRIVTEELRATMSAVAPTVTLPTTAPDGMPADGTPPPSPTGQTATNGASPSEPAPPPPPPPAPEPAPPPPPEPAPPPPPPAPEPVAAKSPGELFGELMKVVAPAKNSGKLTDADIADTLAPYNIASLGLLMNRPDLIPAIHTTFVAIVTAKG